MFSYMPRGKKKNKNVGLYSTYLAQEIWWEKQ